MSSMSTIMRSSSSSSSSSVLSLSPHRKYIVQVFAQMQQQSMRKQTWASSISCSSSFGRGNNESVAAANKGKSKVAVVRGVPDSFANALAMEKPASPVNLERAREQHAAYVQILRGLVQEVIEIPADNQYPDCPFIEDTAIVIGNQALITRPGAVSRQGEEVEVHHALAKMGLKICEVQPPGLIDGGDVLYASGLLFAGKSRRTNDDGILALTNAFPEIGVHPIKVAKGLHLKSALTCIAPRTLAVEDNEDAQAMFEELQKMTAQHFKSFQVSVAGAANTLWVGDTLLISSTLAGDLEPHFKQFAGEVVPVDISEFHKADGGLTCLSLIFEL